ncbi:hypothetical protein SPRG_10780 [Saprolegnia parasitica CBS 223.65]|uniref:TauD/TfdA-like domain-containing protein n=1 Tax=Saprolegnia parasitica (strain CBS 223.65) TaxID=695850 RepID=A0A067C369_SAPPC|nr:hypothetical protein SPRG_10780 [Saprolegnia parasitica CBS 223.65]KDO23585.1 hypothetical protein SPRG_10780 [Saprolegnia parasitica CBS 223.65]|eukprot:XP_012205733.1 hypothetical protein SPRG_10780 [Saprolegnia parasitica CBS 223.65]
MSPPLPSPRLDGMILDAIRPLLNLGHANDVFVSTGQQLLAASIAAAVEKDLPITFVLPAFPCKSPNAATEVLGVLPDRGEELALGRLEAMCAAIGAVYPPGATVTIFSDGRVFSAILGVPTAVVLAYKKALVAMAADHAHIVFDSLDNHADSIDALLRRFHVDANVVHDLLQHDAGLQATHATFLGFLARDLPEATSDERRAAANAMLQRNVAFARLVDEVFPSAIRLSIHATSNAGPKFGVLLLPQAPTTRPRTPWHCVVCEDLDGTVSAIPRHEVDTTRYELVTKRGQPWGFVETPESALAAMDVTLAPWRQGLLITANNTRHHPLSLRELPARALRALATKHSVVCLRGFCENDDIEAVASHLGEILSWPTGNILELKQDKLEGLASRSHEPMAFHYDGMFKRIPNSNVLGDVPLYQFFQCFQPYPDPDDDTNGRTLFVDSRRLLAALPANDVDRLRGLRMTAQTAANAMYGSASLTHYADIVSRHPVTGEEILRFHEPWGADRTEYQPTTITIQKKDGGSEDENATEQAWCFETLVPLLYDATFCYSHQWRKGDFVLSDNFVQLHSRTPMAKVGREIQRIHIN